MKRIDAKTATARALALGGLGILMLVILRLAIFADQDWRGDIDPLAAETPVKLSEPFAETCSERVLKSRYREPILSSIIPAFTPNMGIGKALGGTEIEISEAAMTKAHKIYQERCASCHGDQGDGKGPGAFAVKPKPRDYTDANWQTTVTNDELSQVIVRGGAALGKSYMMPANRDLKSKTEVVAGLVRIVRSFANKP
jgi:cytochrome c553